MTDKKLIESTDKDNNPYSVYVSKPGTKDFRASNTTYNAAWSTALSEGAMMRAKLHNYVVEQGVWTDKKEEEYKKSMEEIRGLEKSLKKGGLLLSEAKAIALNLQKLRIEFRNLISEKQSLEQNCAESQAENARFNFLITRCVYNESGNLVWKNVEEYEGQSDEPWAIAAASEVARMLYDLDPDYEKNLVENKFLVKYKFAREDLKLQDEKGRLIDEEGRFIDGEGRWIEYREDNTTYFVNRDKEEIDEDGQLVVEFVDFIDDINPPKEQQKESTTPE